MSYNICPECNARPPNGNRLGWIDVKLCPLCAAKPRKKRGEVERFNAVKDTAIYDGAETRRRREAALKGKLLKEQRAAVQSPLPRARTAR